MYFCPCLVRGVSVICWNVSRELSNSVGLRRSYYHIRHGVNANNNKKKDCKSEPLRGFVSHAGLEYSLFQHIHAPASMIKWSL